MSNRIPSCYNSNSLLYSLSLIHLNSPKHYIVWSIWWPWEIDAGITIWQMGKLQLELCPSWGRGRPPSWALQVSYIHLKSFNSEQCPRQAGGSGCCCKWGGRPPWASLGGGGVWACPSPACVSACPLSSWHCYSHDLWHPVPFYLLILFKVILVTVAFLALITIYNYCLFGFFLWSV